MMAKELKLKKYQVVQLQTKINHGIYFKFWEKSLNNSQERSSMSSEIESIFRGIDCFEELKKKVCEIDNLKKKLAGSEEDKMRSSISGLEEPTKTNEVKSLINNKQNQ